MPLSPSDLGLPPKFPAFRGPQEDTAIALAASDKRFSLLSAPTGTGKSLIYMAVSRLVSKRVLILVGTKGLQHQLMADFEAMGMVDVRGQSNYRCVALDRELHTYGRPGSNCDEGPCHIGVYCSLRQDGGCFYYDAQANARDSSIVVTNYAYWLTLGRHSDPLSIGEFDLLILDEAHSAPDWLSSFCAVDLDRVEIKSLLDTSLPPIDEGVSIWAAWAKSACQVARDRYVSTRLDLSSASGVTRHPLTKKLLRLTDIGHDLVKLSRANEWRRTDTSHRDVRLPTMRTDWVAEETPKGAKFSPVWAHAYAEECIFRGIPRVILSSATLSPVVGKYLGIDPGDSDFHEVKSGFDPSRRPVIWVPTVRVDRHMTVGEIRIWVNRIDQIIKGRLDRKGIIHTRSYDRARLICQYSEYKHLMITHGSRDTREAVTRYKKAQAPCILVSPSLEEGFDFPMDQCRYQIIAKVPFIDGRSPLERARRKSDKDYPNYVAALSLVQMAGRGVRSDDDMCENFIIDDHWSWFRKAVPFPGWFKQAWRVDNKVPKAPSLVTSR